MAIFGSLSWAAAQSQIFIEDFDNSTNGVDYSTSIPECINAGGDDYFINSDGANLAASFQNVNGSFFAAQDVDGAACGGTNMDTVSISGIPISGITNLELRALVAEDDDGSAQDWDGNSAVKFQYQIDGGGYQNGIWFAAVGGTNSEPARDTDFDGVGDGVALTDSFNQFTTSIAGTGSVLDILVIIENLNAGDEDVAFDNIEIFGNTGGPVCNLSISIDSVICVSDTANGTIFISTSGAVGPVSFQVSGCCGTLNTMDSVITNLDTGIFQILAFDGGISGCGASTSATVCDLRTPPPSTLDTLVITEISYNPPEPGTDSLEYIEIFNAGNAPVNLNGYSFADGVTYTFGNVVLMGKEYITVAKDSGAMFSTFGVSTLEWTSGTLVNGGEEIVLVNNLGDTLDFVDYDNSSPWPSAADGGGPSLVLCDAFTDNNDGNNWDTSATPALFPGIFGSPNAADASCGAAPCPPADTTTITSFVCDAASAGITFTTLTNAAGCDSVVQNVVTLSPSFNDTLAPVQICNGDSALIFGNFEMMAGTFTDSATTTSGCDSITTVVLMVSPLQVVQNPITICAGDSVPLPDGSFASMMGTFNDTTTGATGCDSIFSTIVTVLPNSAGANFLTICDGDSVFAGGAFQTGNGIFTDTVSSANGCDSIVTITVTVLPNSMATVQDSLCPGDSIFVGGGFQRMAGSFRDTLMSANGCDSILTTVVKMRSDTGCPGIGNPCPPAMVNNMIVNICEGDSVLINGNFETMAGMFSDTLRTADGQCDSVINTTFLMVNSADTTVVNSFTCEAANAGIIFTTLTNSAGCDSVVQNVVNFDAGDFTTLPALTICEGDSALIFGNIKTTAGTFTDTLQNQNGCDSVLSQDLVVNPSDSIVIMNTTCDASQVGTSTMTFTNAAGCDSVVTTITTLVAAQMDTTTAVEICEGDSAMIFGNFQSMAGFFSDTATSAAGCDSITFTELVVNNVDSLMVMDSICPGDSVMAGGAFQKTAGTFVDILQNQNGCDGILTTILTLRTDSACFDTTGGAGCVPLTVISDSNFAKSTVITTSSFSGSWNGVNGNLPASSTYTMPAMEGQPYGFASINPVGQAKVVETGNNITYFRREFTLTEANDRDVRFRATVDDQMEIYINGTRIALINSFGRMNFKTPGHDVKFFGGQTPVNGFMGGDMYNVVTTMDLDNVLQTGSNELVLVIRNLAKGNDLGGFSFQMDFDSCATSSAVVASAANSNSSVSQNKSSVRREGDLLHDYALTVYPNPANDHVNVYVGGQDFSADLTDLAGRVLHTVRSEAGRSASFDVSQLADGVYMIRVSANGETLIQKVVVK